MAASPRALFSVLALASAVACASHSSLTPALQPAANVATTPAPRGVIPLHVNKAQKTGLNVRLQIAGGSPQPFLFDTGSAGLWAYYNAVGPAKNYRSTHVRATNTYSSGIVYEGTVVYTNVAFEKGYIAGVVPVVIVDGASCTRPNCPAQVSPQNCPNVYKNPPKDHAAIFCLEEGRSLFGTFGADLEPALVPSPSPPATAPPGPVVLYNVLFGIASWSKQFIVAAPHELQLGPRKAATTGFTYVRMNPKPFPTDLRNGARSWERDVNVCYTIGTYVKHACIATVFDTGAHNVEFQTAAPFAIPTQAAGCRFVLKGRSFALTHRDGTPIDSFQTGYSSNYNAVHLTTPKPGKTPEVNTGLTFYNRDEVLFDAGRGRIGFRPLPAPAHVARTDCD